MFERFTEEAIKVIMCAQEEARRLGHNFVGTEQILLGLISRDSDASRMLRDKGLSLKDVRVEVEKIIGRGHGYIAVEIPFTPRAKRALELSWDNARNLGHNYIGCEHLLLGILDEREGVAGRVLEHLGFDLDNMKADVLTVARQGKIRKDVDKTIRHGEYQDAVEKACGFVERKIAHLDDRLSSIEEKLDKLLEDLRG